ncbi:MAG: guanylate kinase, partial [Clostridia bacterium]|nr:guanylate kinase [Clostridia bacterium]
VLEKRLRGRGTETEDKILKRLKNAEGELEYIKKYDYVIINKGLEEAYDDLCTAIKAERSLSRFFEVKE